VTQAHQTKDIGQTQTFQSIQAKDQPKTTVPKFLKQTDKLCLKLGKDGWRIIDSSKE